MRAQIPAAAVDRGIRPLSDKEFALFRDFIRREAGISLSADKKTLLVGRLSRRLRELRLASFGAYYAHVTRGNDPEEKMRLVNAICTHETHFFREPRQFDLLEQKVFPEWEALAAVGRRPRRIRVWSAACSSGEEPYSLAMLLLTRFPPESGWSVEILATDLSTRVLERARAAIWPVEKAEEIPKNYLKPFMLKGVGSHEGDMAAGPVIRDTVQFAQVNLNDSSYPVCGPFDLTFCRNVLIYFSADNGAAVIRRLTDHMAPGGYLLLGHAETLMGLTDGLRGVGSMTYRRTGKRSTEAGSLPASALRPMLQAATI